MGFPLPAFSAKALVLGWSKGKDVRIARMVSLVQL
jgi:hypothetical protein